MLGLHYQNVIVEDKSQMILDILHKLEHFILLFIYYRGRQYIKFKVSVYHKIDRKGIILTRVFTIRLNFGHSHTTPVCQPYFEINIE